MSLLCTPGQIVTVNFGGSGIKIAEKFWKHISDLSGVNLQGECKFEKEAITDSYFLSRSDKKLIPRAVFADLSNNEMERLRCFEMKEFFNKDNMSYCRSDSGLWANGHYTDGAEIVDSIMNNVRKEAEKCDNLKGINMNGYLSGGAGGLGTLIGSKISEEFTKVKLIGFHGIYGPKHNSISLEPYNTLLSLNS